MSSLSIALIVVGSVLAYAVGCGVTYAIGKCSGWKFDDVQSPAPVGVALWPALVVLVPPFLLIALLVEVGKFTARLTTRLLAPRVKLPRAEIRR